MVAKLLKEGLITLDSGQVIHVKDCLGSPLPGRKVVVLGDTSQSDSIIEVCIRFCYTQTT